VTDFHQFIDEHWRDIIALYIIHMGVGVVLYSRGNTDISHIGESLILAGAGMFGMGLGGSAHNPKQVP